VLGAVIAETHLVKKGILATFKNVTNNKSLYNSAGEGVSNPIRNNPNIIKARIPATILISNLISFIFNFSISAYIITKFSLWQIPKVRFWYPSTV